MLFTLLTVIVIGAVDFGRIAYTAMALTNAARAGAMWGSQSIQDAQNTTGMQAAASASASSDIGAITTAATRSCECDVGGVVTVMANCPPLGVCAGTVRIRVTVTASKTFNSITRFPGVPRSVLITRSAIMRAQ